MKILVLISLLLSVAASANSLNDLGYLINDGEVTITYCDPSVTGTVVIPATIEGQPVTAIGTAAFAGTRLASVVIPEGVTLIDQSAFENSTLAEIEFPVSLERIQGAAFRNCDSLVSVTLPNGLDLSEGYETFAKCDALETVNFSPGVVLGRYTFRECDSLTSIVFPEGMSSQRYDASSDDGPGSYAFQECIGITSVTLGDDFTEVPYGIFFNCHALSQIDLGSVQHIGENAFFGTGWTFLVLPETLEQIGNGSIRTFNVLQRTLIVEADDINLGDNLFWQIFSQEFWDEQGNDIYDRFLTRIVTYDNNVQVSDSVRTLRNNDPRYNYSLYRSVIQRPSRFSVIANVTAGGAVSGAGSFGPGTEVNLEAVADPGYLFLNWTGGASGNESTLQLVVNQNVTVSANFAPDLSDADDDGVSNYIEATVYGSDPNRSDTSGDGIPDNLAIALGWNPLVGNAGLVSAVAENADALGVVTQEAYDQLQTELESRATDAEIEQAQAQGRLLGQTEVILNPTNYELVRQSDYEDVLAERDSRFTEDQIRGLSADYTIGLNEAGNVQMKFNLFRSTDLDSFSSFAVDADTVSVVDGNICLEFAPEDRAAFFRFSVE